MTLTVSGAYGRDYKSKKEILADWNAGKDFVNRGLDGGAYVNREDAERYASRKSINVRYKRDTMVAVLSPVIAPGSDNVTGWRIA